MLAASEVILFYSPWAIHIKQDNQKQFFREHTDKRRKTLFGRSLPCVELAYLHPKEESKRGEGRFHTSLTERASGTNRQSDTSPHEFL